MALGASSSCLGVKHLGRPSDEFLLFYSIQEPRTGVGVDLRGHSFTAVGRPKASSPVWVNWGRGRALGASLVCGGINRRVVRLTAAHVLFHETHQNGSKLPYM